MSGFRPGGRDPREAQNLGSGSSPATLGAFLNAREVELQIAFPSRPSLAKQPSEPEVAGKSDQGQGAHRLGRSRIDTHFLNERD